MADYIDRENYCLGVCYYDFLFCDKSRCPIWQAPAADVAEVRHGCWLEDEGETFCSECRESAPHETSCEELFDYDWEENLVPCGYEEHIEYVKTNYCPNCGAKMDGGDT